MLWLDGRTAMLATDEIGTSVAALVDCNYLVTLPQSALISDLADNLQQLGRAFAEWSRRFKREPYGLVRTAL